MAVIVMTAETECFWEKRIDRGLRVPVKERKSIKKITD